MDKNGEKEGLNTRKYTHIQKDGKRERNLGVLSIYLKFIKLRLNEFDQTEQGEVHSCFLERSSRIASILASRASTLELVASVIALA